MDYVLMEFWYNDFFPEKTLIQTMQNGLKYVPSIFNSFLDSFFFFNELFTGHATFYNRHFDNFKYKFSQNPLDFCEMETC